MFQVLENMLVGDTDDHISSPNTFPKTFLPAFQHNNIAVCLGLNNKFVLYAAVLLSSLIEHATDAMNYDVVILIKDCTEKNEALLQSFGKNNISIRILDMQDTVIPKYQHLFTPNLHISQESYYRLFIPQIFDRYDKVLYLDSDTLVCTDIAELFCTDLGDDLLGAAHDVDIFRQSIIPGNTCKQYINKLLNVALEDYFNAGVLLFNLKQIKSEKFEQEIIATLNTIKEPFFLDQDVLNAASVGRVKFLDYSWNYCWHIPIYAPNLTRGLPAKYYRQYAQASISPRIIHYTSKFKPWNYPEGNLADQWWAAARRTPFYEELLFNTAKVLNSGDRPMPAQPPKPQLPETQQPIAPANHASGHLRLAIVKMPWLVKIIRFFVPERAIEAAIKKFKL